MSDIKVSIIIPVYNIAPYLCECLDSLISQTLQEIEIICIDDGSTDESLEILRKYQELDSRIQILTQKNSGAGAARNAGLKIARGEYLSILDGDDFFKPHMLEYAYNRGKELSAEIVMFRHHRYDHKSKREYDLPHMMNKNNFPQQSIFCVDDMRRNKVNYFFAICGWTWDKLFLRSYIENLGLQFQNTRIFNDMYFTFSAVAVAKRITYLEDVLLCQRVNREGAISKSTQKNWYCALDALSAVRNFLIQSNKYKDFIQYYSTYALHMLLYTLNQVSGVMHTYMQIVCTYYGLHHLGLDLSHDSTFLNPEELKEAQKYFLGVKENLLEKEQIEIVSREVYNLKAENSQLKKEIIDIYLSKSYKIGRIITFFPRKIRSGIHCYREHGTKYTLERIKEKFLGG